MSVSALEGLDDVRSLSEISDRGEDGLVGVRCFDRLRRIVELLNEKDRKIWPNPAHLSEISLILDGLLMYKNLEGMIILEPAVGRKKDT